MESIKCVMAFAAGLSFGGCAAVDEAPSDDELPAVAEQAVYYGKGAPGAVDNSTSGRRSAIGQLVTPDGGGGFGFCSGTLVRNNIVITAQHCNPVAGSTTFSFPGTAHADEVFNVTRVALAPDWQPNSVGVGPNDIAVMQLDRAVPRYVAQPLWLLIDPPETHGLSLWQVHNPSISPPELVGYGGTVRYDKGDGAGTRRIVPGIGVEFASDGCDTIFDLSCWDYPFWQSANDLDSPVLNYTAEGDSGGALIGYVSSVPVNCYSIPTIKRVAIPVLLGALTGWWRDSWGISTVEGQMESAMFNVSPALRNFLQTNVYDVPEEPYATVPGPAIQSLALYGTDWGIILDDRAQVYNSSGGYGNVGSNPLGWMGVETEFSRTVTPQTAECPHSTLFGPDVKIGSIWANNSSLSIHNRTAVSGTATAEGKIEQVTGGSAKKAVPFTRIDMPKLKVTGGGMPTGARCASIKPEPGQRMSVPTDCVYVPEIVVKTGARVTFPCSSKPFHVGALSTEPNGALVFTTGTTCPTATVYAHGTVTLKGTMSSGIDPHTSSTSNVLLVALSNSLTSIQTRFSGVLIAPNSIIHAVPTYVHHGAFYGKRVYLEQDGKLYHRPLNGSLPLE